MSMAFCHRLDNFIISAFKPQNSYTHLSIQPSFNLPSHSSFKVQNFPFRVRYNPTIRATSSSSSPPTTIAEPNGIKVFFLSFFLFFDVFVYPFKFYFNPFQFFLFFLKINSIPTKPIEGQKTGTSGLRKKVSY
jgi:phosphoglucomutase